MSAATATKTIRLVEDIRAEFSRLLDKSDIASWNQREAQKLLERAFTKALALASER